MSYGILQLSPSFTSIGGYPWSSSCRKWGCHVKILKAELNFSDLSKFDSRRKSVRCPRQNIALFDRLILERKFYKTGYVAQADQKLGSSSRDVVARANMVHNGILDPDYPLSEVNRWSKARGALFYTVTAVCAIFLFVLMVVGHPFVLILDPCRRRFQHLIAKTWASLTIAPFFKVEYVGLENLPRSDVPAVYVSNHQSFLDIYTLLTLGRSFKFISKTSIFLYPIIGWAMFLLGVIPLKRMDSRSQLECVKRCMELIKGGASVFFFPEGTRSKDGKLGTFKKGAFSVATKTGVPVVPITLQGTGNIMPVGKEGLLNQGSVKVYIHPPLVGSDPEELRKEAMEVISQKLNFGD